MEGSHLIAAERIIGLSSPGCEEYLEEIVEWASIKNIKFLPVTTGEEIDSNFVEVGKTIGITIGGDGTFLEGARAFAPQKIPFIGIGLGTMSFLPRVEGSRKFDALEEIFCGRAKIEEQHRISIKTKTFEADGLNEVIIGHIWPKKPTDRKISSMRVFAGGEYVGKYEGTGISLSTPTGSTGVSLSAGGAIHYPRGNKTIQMTPMHTHNIGVCPIVFGGGIEIKVIPETEVYVLVDGGRVKSLLDTKEVIKVTSSQIPSYLIRTSYDRGFFEGLSKNLGWGIREDYIIKKDYNENEITFDEKVLQLAKNAALSSGGVLRELQKKEELETFKNRNGGMSTEADYLSEQIIVSLIKNEFPEHNIISEENEWPDTDSDYKWVIDPLDGTGNFIHKNPNYAVSIAFLEKESLKIGVIYIPETNQLFWAKDGDVAMLNGKIISTTNRDVLRESMLITGHDPDGKLQSSLYSEVKGVRRWGSAAINLSYLACGTADIVWEWDTETWDVAAGILIARCAGAKVTRRNGDEYKLDFSREGTNEMLASNGALHAALMQKI